MKRKQFSGSTNKYLLKKIKNKRKKKKEEKKEEKA